MKLKSNVENFLVCLIMGSMVLLSCINDFTFKGFVFVVMPLVIIMITSTIILGKYGH